MNNYALINDVGQVLKIQKFDKKPKNISHKGLKWLPYIVETTNIPKFHKTDGTYELVNKKNVTLKYNIVPMSKEECEAILLKELEKKTNKDLSIAFGDGDITTDDKIEVILGIVAELATVIIKKPSKLSKKSTETLTNAVDIFNYIKGCREVEEQFKLDIRDSPVNKMSEINIEGK